MSKTQASAIVAYAPSEPFKADFRHETIELARTTPGPQEVLVRVLAVGICHTDIVIGGAPDGAMGPYPKVLGHEGSGYVEAVGSNVKSVAVGDPVLLSYTYCGSCDLCTDGDLTYCQNFVRDNIACGDHVWQSKEGTKVGGKFFGQSSFASLTMVDEQSLVNAKGLVTGDDDLKKFSPLGCGLMTGSGAVVYTAAAKPQDVILIAGLGAVGLGAVMAAKIQGCRGIIVVDRVESRLALAKELGATQVFNTSHMNIADDSYAADLAKELKKLAPEEKINYAIDTTGALKLINGLILSMSKRGKLIAIGIPIPFPTSVLPLDFQELFDGAKRMEVNLLGDAVAKEHVPKMIQWYKDGKFPFDKFIKFYDAKDISKALEEMKSEVIKPILVH